MRAALPHDVKPRRQLGIFVSPPEHHQKIRLNSDYDTVFPFFHILEQLANAA
jgi:hypothetical protein